MTFTGQSEPGNNKKEEEANREQETRKEEGGKGGTREAQWKALGKVRGSYGKASWKNFRIGLSLTEPS